MDLKNLKDPFPASDIEWRVGATNKDKTKGIALAYITNRAIMERLDDVCGPVNWRNNFLPWKENSQLCGISIRVGEEWITKWDGADDSKMEGTKGGLSDAMKRAGYQWGIGRYLYHLPNTWVRIEARGNSFVLSETPSLPAWALPGGSGKPDGKSTTHGSGKTDGKDATQEPQEDKESQDFPIRAGVIEDVSTKSGTHAGKEWRTTGIKVGSTWYSTFDKDIGAWLEERKGMNIEFQCEKRGKYWNILQANEVIDINADAPKDEDLPF